MVEYDKNIWPRSSAIYDTSFGYFAERWRASNRRLDNRLGPAGVDYYDNGLKEYEEYRVNGIYHRIDGPTISSFDEDGNVIRVDFYLNDCEYEFDDWFEKVKNQLTEDQRKQLKETYNTCSVVYSIEDDAANEEYIWIEEWSRCFTTDNTSGPASVAYRKNGLKSWESWKLYDAPHRLDGPSEIWYNDDGTVKEAIFAFNGYEDDFVEWIKIVRDKLPRSQYVELLREYDRTLERH